MRIFYLWHILKLPIIAFFFNISLIFSHINLKYDYLNMIIIIPLNISKKKMNFIDEDQFYRQKFFVAHRWNNSYNDVTNIISSVNKLA